MPKVHTKRGRPKLGQAATAAERMRAYRARKRASGLKRVGGWESVEGSLYSDHRLREARSLALHCRIARKISRAPGLLRIAVTNLERWTERASGREPAYLREWRQILDRPWPQIADFITSFGADAVRLRQSSPFAGVLTPAERRKVYDAFGA